MIRALTAVFWITAVAAVCWVAALAWNYELVAAAASGEKGSRLVTTVLMGALALLSGLLTLYHRGDDDDGDDHYWTVAELIYAVFLFLSLFYGVYSFFGWFFYA